MREHIVAVTTIGGEEEAVRLARALLERRLVACVNILDSVRSLYRWKGAVEDDREHLLFMKTRGDRYPALESALEELHPYDVPELIVLPIERGSSSYLSWIDENVTTDSADENG